MGITFAKAPLIELIAELRWTPQGSTLLEPAQPGLPPALFLGGAKQEEFYTHVASALHKAGFNRSERLSPVGVPFTMHEAVYRFRSDDDNTSVLYQVGFGIFSVHAVPPYHSWSEFLPFVKAGIEILLRCRPEADLKQPFGQTNLRYIDFFGEHLTQGRSVPSFISDVFGIRTTLPDALTKLAASNELKSLYIKIAQPTKVGELAVSAGDGQFNNQPGILLDTTMSSSETAPTLDAIMNRLDASYAVIHELFLGMTKPIHSLMQPQGVDAR
jgi:uncharacterized protein (TIGR04255 family)